MGQHDELASGSVVVVAHPDDELLWLSSVSREASRIVFCYGASPRAPGRGAARRRLVSSYPRGCRSLDIDEPGAFNQADWQRPEETPYGLLCRNRDLERRYQYSFERVRERLSTELRGVRRVITHNPWGEYGNEEHVQVFRAVESLSKPLGFEVWFSNYCSRRSALLMSRQARRVALDSARRAIDEHHIRSLLEVYKSCGCWTWFDDYRWPDEETLFRLSKDALEEPISGGRAISTNMLIPPGER